MAVAAPLSGAPARASWSPVACHGTALAPSVLLAAKLLVLYVWIVGVKFAPDVHLPFLPFLDAVPAIPGARTLATLVFGAASLAILLNHRVRLASFTCGALVLASVLSSRLAYSNSRTFLGLLFVWIALQDPALRDLGGRWMLRAQLALVYGGAGLNKLLDPDWRSGRFFEHWTLEVLELPRHASAAALLPEGLLWSGLGWITIVAELGLASLFAATLWRRGLTPWAVAAGLGLHTGMLVYTAGEISWVFLYAMGAAYLCLADPPPRDPRGLAERLHRALLRPVPVLALAALFFAVRHQFFPLNGPLLRWP